MAAEALEWICGLLRERDIPFQICGGLAAIGYGAQRPLHDIDLFVPGEHFEAVVFAGSAFVSKPAKHYREGEWDLEYVQFIFGGTKIEVGNAAGAKVLHSFTDQWMPLEINFARSHNSVLLGVEVPLMARDDLVRYKKALNRSVDREDIAAMKRRLDQV